MESGLLLVAGAVMVLVALAFCFLVPAKQLPLIALILYCLVPQKALPGQTVQLFAPALVVLVVWGIRRLLSSVGRDQLDVGDGQRTGFSKAMRSCIVLLILVSGVLAVISLNRFTSFGWLLYFSVGLLMPLLVRNFEEESRSLRNAVPILGSLIAGWSVFEFVLGYDPVYSVIYDVVGRGDYQHWASYRADGTFGHPLFAGTFFAVTTVVSLAAWISSRERKNLFFAAMCAVGLVLTLSRGAFVAAALGVLTVLLLAARQDRTNFSAGKGRGVLGILGITSLGVLVVSQLDFVTDRLGGAEAQSSNEGRNAILGISIRAAEDHNYLGSGPGTSRSAALPFNHIDLPIESGYLELLISLGVLGVLAFIGIGVMAVLCVFRRRDVLGVAFIVPLFVAIGFYNSLDGQRSTALLIGIFLIAACGGVQSSTRTASELSKQSMSSNNGTVLT